MQIVNTPLRSLVNSLCCLLFSTLIVLAEKKQIAEGVIYQGGIRNCAGDDGLSKKEIQQLLKSLQIKTGYQNLSFDAQGFLVVTEPEKFSGGSATARRLLLSAIASPRQFHLTRSNHNTKINFSRLNVGVYFRNMEKSVQIEIVPLQFDFTDFQQLFGEADVLASFDLGIVFLHELVHGVHGLRDVEIDSDDIGECEEFMNAIRRELNLPERDRYVARTVRAGYELDRPLYLAQLPFVRNIRKKGNSETQTTFLQWNAERVGMRNGNANATIAVTKTSDARQAATSIH